MTADRADLRSGRTRLLNLDQEVKFWAKVEYRANGCWQWSGRRSTTEYGVFVLDGRNFRAHRVAYELRVGPIPEGLQLDHLCRNRSCVNPAHLEPVTNRENTLRGVNHVAALARVTHCPAGHEYTPESTRLRRSRYGTVNRSCRTCDLERRAGRQARAPIADDPPFVCPECSKQFETRRGAAAHYGLAHRQGARDVA